MTPSQLEALYRRYGSLVLRRARSILGSDDLANDLMQEVFLRVIRRGDSFRGDASPSTWLYRITTNLCLNRLRDEKRRHLKLVAQHTSSASTEKKGGQDLRIDLRRLLEELPKELSEVAIYYHLDGMDQKEIAEILAVPRRTIGHRLERFAKLAKQLLQKEPQAALDELRRAQPEAP